MCVCVVCVCVRARQEFVNNQTPLGRDLDLGRSATTVPEVETTTSFSKRGTNVGESGGTGWGPEDPELAGAREEEEKKEEKE
eukprot:424737-Rhodomonas_salina.1